MTLFETLLLYFSSVASAFLLIAGGWVKIRDWFKAHAEAKAQEAAAAAKAEADKVEALVQVRLKQLQAEAAAAPDSTATSTSGPVVCCTHSAPEPEHLRLDVRIPFYENDNLYHLSGSSRRGALPRGGGLAGIGWFSYFIVIIIMCAGY